MAINIQVPYQNFVGLDGKPLSNGKVYIGNVSTDPTVPANQVPLFWDSALTIPASQPLFTNAGYVTRNGTPAKVYTSGNYSITVTDGSNITVYYLADAGATGDIAGAGGSSLIGGGDQMVPSIAALRLLKKTSPSQSAFVQGYYVNGDGGGGQYYLDTADSSSPDNSGTVIVAADGGRWKLAQVGSVSVKQFGAKGDGTTPDTAAIQAALSYGAANGTKTIYAPAGAYVLTAPVSVTLSGLQSLALVGDGSDQTEFRFIGAATGFAFAAASGNWWFNVSPGSGFKFEGFSVTTSNINFGVGFAVNGGAVTGRPGRKTLFTDITFRGLSDFSHSWAAHVRITDCGGAWFESCRWMIGGSGNLANEGLQIVGTTTGNPSGFYLNNCEAFYGGVWINAGNNVEGLYMTNCSHVAGARALVWTATAESGLHIVGGHYNNTIVNFALNGVFDYEIVGALLYCDGHGASFTFITAQNGGQGTIVGNTFVGQNAGTEIGILIDNSSSPRYGITISGNAFSNIAGYAVQLGVNAKYVTVGDNGYNACSAGDVNNLGTDNRVAKRRLAFTTVVTMVGGAAAEAFSIPLPSSMFRTKPSAASITAGSGIVGFYDYDHAASSATSLWVTARDINASPIPAGALRFSVIAEQ